MITSRLKAKNSDNVQVNFNQSKEIAYWAKKYNISPDHFQQLFQQAGYSISNVMALIPVNNRPLL